MANDPTISKHLEETGGFSDRDPPVLITSGESLTPFFVNAEKLCRDEFISDYLSANADDAKAIINHCSELTDIWPEFGQVIEIMSKKVETLLKEKNFGRYFAISGGQRRDWIFSGPIARKLDVPHISLYKQEVGQREENDKVEWLLPTGEVSAPDELPFYVVQVVDLITKGSSVYDIDPKTRREIGWLPMLRSRGAEVDNLVAVVTRLQGGEEMLAGKGVNVHSFVAIDEEFLRAHSNQPEAAISYVEDERKWTENYLLEHGVGILVPYFKPEGKNFSRASKFYRSYHDFLANSGLMADLGSGIGKEYGKRLVDIVGGK